MDISLVKKALERHEQTKNIMGEEFRDADTVLYDLLFDEQDEQAFTGVGEELIKYYLNIDNEEAKKAYEYVFETLIGVSFEVYILECMRRITDSDNLEENS